MVFDWRVVGGVKDSKQMMPASREILYSTMTTLREDGKLDFAVAFSSSSMIDTHGIVPAIKSALARALAKIQQATPLECEVRLDGGLRAPVEFVQQTTIIRGDQSEPIISLASIAAKVERDQLMVRLAEKYPAYAFETHKGYGTPAHCSAIRNFGLSAIHRRTFCTRISLAPST